MGGRWTASAFSYILPLLQRVIEQPSSRLDSWRTMPHCSDHAGHVGETRYVVSQFHETYPLIFESCLLRMTLLHYNQDHRRTLPGPSRNVFPSVQFLGHWLAYVDSPTLVADLFVETAWGYKTQFISLMNIPRLNQLLSHVRLVYVVVPFYAPSPASFGPSRRPSIGFLMQIPRQHMNLLWLESTKLIQSLGWSRIPIDGANCGHLNLIRQ